MGASFVANIYSTKRMGYSRSSGSTVVGKSRAGGKLSKEYETVMALGECQRILTHYLREPAAWRTKDQRKTLETTAKRFAEMLKRKETKKLVLDWWGVSDEVEGDVDVFQNMLKVRDDVRKRLKKKG